MLRDALLTTALAERRTLAARRRAEAAKARTDTRAWAVDRRERTHHLIELGGLVQKSGLVDLTGDDRAMLYGAFLTLVDGLGGEGNRAHVTALWRRRGKRAFDADEAAAAAPLTATPFPWKGPAT